MHNAFPFIAMGSIEGILKPRRLASKSSFQVAFCLVTDIKFSFNRPETDLLRQWPITDSSGPGQGTGAFLAVR